MSTPIDPRCGPLPTVEGLLAGLESAAERGGTGEPFADDPRFGGPVVRVGKCQCLHCRVARQHAGQG